MKEIRELSAFLNCEFRLDDGDSPKINGYAAVFNSRSQNLGGFVEVIKPGTFSRSISAKADVRALVDHDPSRIIGRTKSGTLKIREDEKGLKIEVIPPNTSVGRDVLESIRRGDLDGMSFGFRTIKDNWNEKDGEVVRELLDVDLVDISIVSFPAYLATSVSARSMEEILAEGLARLEKEASEALKKPTGPSVKLLEMGLRLKEKEFENFVDK